MRMLVSEYALLVLSIIAAVIVLWILNYMGSEYHSFSNRFISTITGVDTELIEMYNESGEGLSLEEIEKMNKLN